MIIDNEQTWMNYAISAWSAAGRPVDLNPEAISADPLSYDRFYYEYFEQRYLDMWLAIYSRVNPANGSLLDGESVAFREAWSRNFSWQTIWKQILPLLVYGNTLGATHDVLVELGSLYCLGQAIPSMVVDRLLDGDVAQSNTDAAFCVLAYDRAIRGIRALNIPCGTAVEDTFLRLTGEMYDRMLSEYSRRYEPLPIFISDAIRDYLSPQSRLLSSIFFGVLPVWAYLLANKTPPTQILESLVALRTVRQLNDEMLDVREDICHGLLTLPWLFALEERPTLKSAIEKLWEDTTDAGALMECQRILRMSFGQQRAAAKSTELLSQSMKATIDAFSADVAFDISLLHHIRSAFLIRFKKMDYEQEGISVREPSLPQNCILDSSNAVEPIAGSGVLVVGADQKVLMTLVLKRGMLRWELPAGVAHHDESLEETARREAFEETGKRIEIGDVIAICWHHSRSLGKGWMGIFFEGRAIPSNSNSDFLVVRREALGHAKSNIIKETPGLYKSVDLESYDFHELLCESRKVCSTAHESIVAAGFVDWRNIPVGRMHPLHRKLLEARAIGQPVELLVSDADGDFAIYDCDSKLYFSK